MLFKAGLSTNISQDAGRSFTMHFIRFLIILSSVYALPVPVVQDRRPPSQSLSPRFNAEFEPETVFFFDRAGDEENNKGKKRRVPDDAGEAQTQVAGDEKKPPKKQRNKPDAKQSASRNLYNANWNNNQKKSKGMDTRPVEYPPLFTWNPIRRPGPPPSPGPKTSKQTQLPSVQAILNPAQPPPPPPSL